MLVGEGPYRDGGLIGLPELICQRSVKNRRFHRVDDAPALLIFNSPFPASGNCGDRTGCQMMQRCSRRRAIVRHSVSSGQWEDGRVNNLAIMEPVAPRSSLEIGQNAAEIVAPEWNVIGPDVAGIGDALMAALGGAVKNPADVMTASMRLSSDLARIPSTVLNSWVRKQKGDDKGSSDRRFADPAWTDNPYFHAIRLAYLAQCEFARAIVGSSGIDAKQAAKASLGLDLLLDAMGPRISRSRIQPR